MSIKSPSNEVLLIGLAFNFVTMMIGGLMLLSSVMHFAIENESRMTRLESQMTQLMQAQGLRSEPLEVQKNHESFQADKIGYDRGVVILRRQARAAALAAIWNGDRLFVCDY